MNGNEEMIKRPLSGLIEEILAADEPSHCILAYKDLRTFREIYTRCTIELLRRNEIVVLWPFYREVEDTRFWLENSGIDVSGYQRSMRLLIIDALDVYSNKEDDIVELISEFAAYARNTGKRRVVIIGDLRAFWLIERIDQLISYEAWIGTRIMDNVKVFCYCHVDDIRDLEGGHLARVCGSDSCKLYTINDVCESESLAAS
ncbi:MAG TPA: MEDS domain-containing protein [Nitrososphaera sp.]